MAVLDNIKDYIKDKNNQHYNLFHIRLHRKHR